MRHTLLVILLLVPGYLFSQDPAVKVARDYRSENGSAILAGFAELLSIPNVASDTEGIGRNAVYIRDQFRERGIEMELLTLPDVPPIIFGEITRPNATRTLAIYVHYDGQPADPTQWTHDPWEATLYTAAMEEGGEPRPFPKPGEEIDPEWRLYARSAGDDKAPIAALLAVLDAFRESDIAITSNIKFFFEGEEEAGSARLPEYLETYRDRLGDIDVWLFCDGPVHQSRSPQLVFGAVPRSDRNGGHDLRRQPAPPQRPLRQLGTGSGHHAGTFAG